MRTMTILATALILSMTAHAAGAEPQLTNVALTTLGATAKGSGAKFNSGWPAIKALLPDRQRGGTIFGAPLTGGRVDIRLVVPVDIKAIEVIGLDYGGTRQPKSVDIYIEGQLVKQVELPNQPNRPFRIALEGRGRHVAVVVTGEHPVRQIKGRPGPTWGGWKRIRILSTTDVAALMRDVDDYDVPVVAGNIAATTGSAVEGDVEVVGQPRQTAGHPCTLWDNQDIAHYKQMLQTSEELQAQYAGLLAAMDGRMTEPLGIPQPKQAADGSWTHLPATQYGGIHNQLGLDIANMGAAYALSGEAKYGEYAKRLLLAYADVFDRYGIGARPGFNHDPSKVFDQRLGDATWLIQVARGYDLIYNLPSITDVERAHIQDDLVRASARHILANRSVRSAPTNWSAIDMVSVLIAGYATDDDDLITQGLYGASDGGPDNIKGGAFFHFGPKCIDADGLWSEGAMGYQFMALEALVAYAEIAWHHGIDFYRYRDGAFKRLFDSPLQFAYPDLRTPAIHDSGHGTLIGGESFLYEFAYRRYRDPRYVPILNQAGMHLDALFQKFAVSVLFDRDPDAAVEATESRSVNFFGVGYGILRHTTSAGTTSLLLDYGPNRSHGHPDKLNIDLWTFGGRLIPDPGSVWYERPMYRRWYHTTLSHNTLVVDELDQQATGAEQLVYAPATSLSMQRARTNSAYPGILMDRAVFLTPNYMADLFGAFGRVERTVDLAFHLRGEFATELATEPMTFSAPVANGYVELGSPAHVVTDQPWSAAVTLDGKTARFVAAGGADTDVIFADGHLGTERPKTILLRRKTASTVYGNAVDISAATQPYVKSVATTGSLAEGYALMTVQTADGEDLCFTSYRPGVHTTGALTTDAQQAFVLRGGDAVTAAYLGGGTILDVEGASIARSTPGLVCVERTEPSSYVISNPSPDEAAVTVTLPALAGMTAYGLDVKGRRTGPLDARPDDAGALQLTLAASAAVELAPAEAVSAYAHRQAMLRTQQAELAARAKLARQWAELRTWEREALAKQMPVPPGTVVVVQGEAFSAEGGGVITIADHKRAAIGTALLGWDDIGHWIEWTVDAPTDGYYTLTLLYCSELVGAERELRVNGDVPDEYAPMIFAATGGWANNSDDWRLHAAANPVADHPLLVRLNAGANTLRLTNINGRGINIDYLAITSPDVKVSRKMLAAQLTPSE